jgi:hypothetical protein
MKNMQHLNLLAFLFATMLLGGCDYPVSDEHISNLQPPPDYMEVELSFLNSGDTIQLFSPKTIVYNFTSIRDNFLSGRFFMGNKEWELTSVSGFIQISPDDFPPGYNSLHLQIYFKSGSGSLADQVGAEVYLAEHSWTILCDSRTTPVLALSHHKNENGFLTFNWTPHENYNFDSYRIERTGYNIPSFTKIFQYRDSLTFVDSCYFAGHVKYTIRAVSKGSAGLGGVDENSSVELNLEKPTMQFEIISPDSIHISWNRHHYNALYNLRFDSSVEGGSYIISASSDTSVVAPLPLFGLPSYFSLSSYPAHCSDSYYGSNFIDVQPAHPGERLVNSINARYAYNKNENVIYAINKQNYLLSFDMESLDSINHFLISDYAGNVPLSTTLSSTTVAALGRNHFYIFQDSNLANPNIIHYENNFLPFGFLKVTENGYIANAHTGQLRVFNITSGQMVTSHPFPSASMLRLEMSNDASFAAFISSPYGLWIYQNNNYSFEEAVVNSLPYSGFLFHPTLPDRIYLIPGLGNILELRSLPDFSLLQTWQLPIVGMNIGNIDPYTGYMLLFHSNKRQIFLLDLENNETVLSMRSRDRSPRFYKFRLFSEKGYTFDVSEFLPKR